MIPSDIICKPVASHIEYTKNEQFLEVSFIIKVDIKSVVLIKNIIVPSNKIRRIGFMVKDVIPSKPKFNILFIEYFDLPAYLEFLL